MSTKQRSKRKRYDSSKTQELDSTAKETVQQLFEKKFTYEKTEQKQWLFSPEQNNLEQNKGMQQDLDALKEQLNELKVRLNDVKDQLSDKDIVLWHQHTKFMHLAGGVMTELKTVFHVEMCTQAWCKFYEILSQFHIIPDNSREINSVHLCEAPGAFISALNHYLKCKDLKDKWNWVATTLSPYYEGNSLNEMIDDDSFIQDTLDNWYFGEDGTGNLMSNSNINGLVSRKSYLKAVQLVTADGSIDCQNSPSDQETLVYKLHFYETLTALKLLDEGGCFVIKLFTMFEESTISLLYILNSTFSKVSVFKPATSKPGNSEVYVICEGYTQHVTGEIFQTLLTNNLTDGEVQMCNISYPKSFLEQHVKCCRQFTTSQIEAIQTNMTKYGRIDEDQRNWQQILREYCQDHFITKYKIRQIPNYSRLTFKTSRGRHSKFNVQTNYEPPDSSESENEQDENVGLVCSNYESSGKSKNKHTGSFYDRQKESNLPWPQRLQHIKTFDVSHNRMIIQHDGEKLNTEDIRKWRILKGKTFKKIECSRFCASKIISILNYILSNKKNIQYKNNIKLCKQIFNLVTMDTVGSDQQNLFCYNCDEDFMDICRDCESIKTQAISDLENMSAIKNGMLYLDVVKGHVTETDHHIKKCLLLNILDILKHLPIGSSIIMKISTCLTRYTASLIYIISTCFIKTSLKKISSSLALQQLLYLQVFNGALDVIVQYLEAALLDLDSLQNSESTILEFVPFSVIIKDDGFMKMMKHCNRNLLTEFINKTIKTERKSFKMETPSIQEDIQQTVDM